MQKHAFAACSTFCPCAVIIAFTLHFGDAFVLFLCVVNVLPEFQAQLGVVSSLSAVVVEAKPETERISSRKSRISS